MPDLSMRGPVLVTGATGFVAGQLVAHLLETGRTVHATVRNPSSSGKMAGLNALAERHPGKLKIFAADLLDPGSFAAAMEGCVVVHHVASPFLMPEKISDGRTQMLEPALEGVRNVLGTVNATPSVERVVMTSTIGAIFGDYIDVVEKMDGVCREAFFNETSTVDHNPYHYSKVMAEKEAWLIAEAQDRWDLVCINPGLVLGPSLSPQSDSGSLFLLDDLLRGDFFYGAARLRFATVDVRDVAHAHAAAADRPEAHGRYIVAAREMASFVQMADALRGIHDRPGRLPRWEIPDWVVRLIGPAFGLSQRYMRNHLGIRFELDNARSIAELGVRYRPLAETLRDHFQSWQCSRGTVGG